MEAGGREKQSRLFRRLFGRFRGHHNHNCNAAPLENTYSLVSTVVCYSMSESGCDSSINNDDDLESQLVEATTSAQEDDNFPANIDLRYGGQYLTPEQLPKFCDQLHHLVEVIRNIQNYAAITGEYPSSLERRLEQEAREVAALAAEARNARDVVARTRLQRRAVRAQRRELLAHLTTLRDTEIRELESTVRLSDRKLFKSWEVLKESSDPSVFEPLLDEIKNKQTALECLVRLIESRRSALSRATPLPHPLPPPLPDRDDVNSLRRRVELANSRRGARRRREPRSVPLSGESSHHRAEPTGTSRGRAGSAGAVVPTVELPPRSSVRDILYHN